MHVPCAAEASVAIAREIAALIRQRAAEGKNAVLGLSTGSTPTAVYNELVRMHREECLSFSNVVTFNLDEYYPIARHELQSYYRFMHEYLFDLVDIPLENVHIPDGTLLVEQVPEFCDAYERAIVEAGGNPRSVRIIYEQAKLSLTAVGKVTIRAQTGRCRALRGNKLRRIADYEPYKAHNWMCAVSR